MVSKNQLLAVLPVRDQIVLAEDRQDTEDIRQMILVKHRAYAADYDLISDYFDTGDIVDTSRGIFDFLKANVPYTKESGKYQTVKSPAMILTMNDGNGNFDRVDCKNYASFICGILDSLRRNKGGQWNWTYRFVSYQTNNKEPGHVFAVVLIDDGELWIDPVFSYFNGGDMHEWELDQKPSKSIGGLYSISGPNESTGQVVVNTKDAARNFLVATSLNLFGIPALMLGNPGITNSPEVQRALLNSGVNLNALTTILKTLVEING